MEDMKKCILNVVARSAEELIKHRKGPGTRYVFSDHNNNPEGSIYVIMRTVEKVDRPEMHIDAHSLEFESLFIFKGNNPDLSGLEVKSYWAINGIVSNPPKPFEFPPGVNHNYRFIKGSGEYWNIVLTPGAEYNKTIR